MANINDKHQAKNTYSNNIMDNKDNQDNCNKFRLQMEITWIS